MIPPTAGASQSLPASPNLQPTHSCLSVFVSFLDLILPLDLLCVDRVCSDRTLGGSTQRLVPTAGVPGSRRLRGPPWRVDDCHAWTPDHIVHCANTQHPLQPLRCPL